MGHPVYALPVSAAAVREVDVVGSFRYANAYPAGIDILSSKNPAIPEFSKLITHRFSGLDSADKAFQMAGRTKDDSSRLVLKVIVEVVE